MLGELVIIGDGRSNIIACKLSDPDLVCYLPKCCWFPSPQSSARKFFFLEEKAVADSARKLIC